LAARSSLTDRLSERARHAGIEPEYRDAQGRLRRVERETFDRVLAAVAGISQPRHLLRASVVVRPGGDQTLTLEVPPRASVRWDLSAEQRIATGEGPQILLPAKLPVGAYSLTVSARVAGKERSETATLLVAPAAAYQGADANRRLWALAVPLYGVRSARNWGHGDFTDLSGLIRLAAELGACGIALNPLHALFDDRPEEASPYSPSSRLFLNPLYIDPDAVPEFRGARSAPPESELAELRARELVDYAGVAAAKMRALRLAYTTFRQAPDPERVRAFEAFQLARNPMLARFAAFELLRRRYHGPWWEWPAAWRNPGDRKLSELRTREGEEIAFFEFVQWIADEQLCRCCEQARALGLAIGLYLDIAVGVRADGFDAWSNQSSILPKLCVGAPPDPINTAGQSWGLAAFNPVALEAQRLAPFRSLLAAAMRYAGAVRLDHVMALRRLYVIPDGMRPDQGAYIRFPCEALLAVCAQESVRHECILIGEDLGTVPEDFRATLSDWGIWSYQVALFERVADGSFLPPESYRRNAVVTFGTHDLPTFAGWEEGADLAVKRALGMDPGESDAERGHARQALRAALSGRGLHALGFPEIVQYLAAAPSRLMVVAIEDVLGAREQANLPGTVDQHPNWRRRPAVLIEDLSRYGGMRAIAEIMRKAGRGR